jgi:hypothetical protein
MPSPVDMIRPLAHHPVSELFQEKEKEQTHGYYRTNLRHSEECADQ